MTSSILGAEAFRRPATSTTKLKLIRYGVSATCAGLVTLALTGSMIAMISQEFQAQTVLKSAKFTINPIADDLPPPDERIELDSYKVVEIPPPPPRREVASAPFPDTPIYTLPGDKDVFDPDDITFDTPKTTHITDSNPAPILRPPATMPMRAQRSGHCDVRFQVGPDGQPFGIETTYCTERLFERPTVKSVAKWKYKPRVRDGRAVTMEGVTARVSFHLKDERGQIIPPN